MFSALPISLEAYAPSSNIRCHRHARASALTSVPDDRGLVDVDVDVDVDGGRRRYPVGRRIAPAVG
jgi:hypothetical protein